MREKSGPVPDSAYIDGFMVLGFAVIAALLLMLILRTPPTPSFLEKRLSGTGT